MEAFLGYKMFLTAYNTVNLKPMLRVANLPFLGGEGGGVESDLIAELVV